MVQRGIRNPRSRHPSAPTGKPQLAPRPFAAEAPQGSRGPAGPEAVGNQDFHRDSFEAFGLQLKAKSGTITSAEQERLGVLQARMDRFWARGAETGGDPPQPPAEARPNETGLPDPLKAGIENLSGYSLDDVRVHYNSPHPARFQALAFTRGKEIHVAPGQERHLPHEAWHAVQQMQGRVEPTMRMRGVPINDKGGLEREADAMGAKAAQGQAGSPPRHLQQAGSPSSHDGIVQRVRMEVASPGFPIDLAKLEEMIAVIDEQIRSLQEENAEEVQGNFIDFDRVRGWRDTLNGQMERLRAVDDGGSYTQDQVRSRADGKLDAYYAAIVTCGNLRRSLNDSFTAYERLREQRKLNEQYQELRGKKAEAKEKKKEPEVKEARKTPTGQGPIGLGTKWGTYREQLKRTDQITFHQHVPEGSATIAKALKSQNLSDAVYHTDKAFWVADPKKYKLSSAAGKVRMEYRFSAEGARSLMEDYLLCGSGDFGEDNEEEWSGETAHPDYTIWKTNEVGAYGIGANRLKQLQAHLVSIRAFDSKDRPIAS